MLLRMLGVNRFSRAQVIIRAASGAAVAADNMRQTAYVRYKPDAENITISLVLGGRQRNLNRSVDEPLEKPISRIKASLAPAKQDKRAKKKKLNAADQAQQQQQQQQQEEELFVGLFRDAAATQLIDLSTPNGQAWPTAAVLKVSSSNSSSADDQTYDIIVNPPTVETLNLPNFPMVGYPILPVVGLAFAGLGFCKWRWLRKLPSGKNPNSAAAAAAASGSWTETGCYNMCYTPTEADIGCFLRVECIPGSAAAPAAGDGVSAPSAAVPVAAIAAAAAQQDISAAAAAAAVSTDAVYGEQMFAVTGPVRPGPSQSAAVIRQLQPGVPLTEPWRFRVMSYNILADQYAGTSYAQEVLFKYCPKELLDNNYRRQLVLEEILRYQPDICCLQEVDDKVFSEYLQPHLTMQGYVGHYTNKQGKVREGSAMFWKKDKWAAAAVQDIKLRDVFKLPLSDRHAQFTEMLLSSPELTEALQKVTTIAQMVLLLPRNAAASSSSSSSDSSIAAAAAAAAAPLLMINTHLFFHPYAPHIRSLHTAAILEEAAAALAEWQQQPQQQQQDDLAAAVEPGFLSQLSTLPDPTVLFCGDLNSDLNDGVPGVIEMLQTGKLRADHWDWKMGATFRWGKEEGEYAEETQQQQQQQSPTAASSSQQQQQQQQQQQSNLPLEDGHDFDQASSPRGSVECHGVDVTIPFVFRSADGLATPYTNYTSGYKALLDYVWYDPKRLHVTLQLAVPAEQLLSSFIPSPSFPSDHLAVVYDLAFKPQNKIGDAVAAGGAEPAAGELRPHDSATFQLLPASGDHISDAVDALRRGEVIALPTDTLYGFAAAACNAAAVQRLWSIKQRSPNVPFAVAVADVADVDKYALTGQLPEGLLRALLPGPVTVLLPVNPDADLAPGILDPNSQPSNNPAATAAAAAAIGIRVVPNEFVRGVFRSLGGGIALTSANLSGQESSLQVQDFRELWQHCGIVFDSGPIPVVNNLGSTVIDLTQVCKQQQQQQPEVRNQAAEAGSNSSGGFRILRAGVAADSVVDLLTKGFGLDQL